MGRNGKLCNRQYPDISPNTSDKAGVNSEVPHSNGGVPGGKYIVIGTACTKCVFCIFMGSCTRMQNLYLFHYGVLNNDVTEL